MISKKSTLEALEQKIKELEIKLDAYREVEKDLLIEKQFSESVINSLPGIFYLFDKKGKFYRWNKNSEKVTKYSTEEISKMSPFDFFGEEDKKRLADTIQEVFVKEKSNVELDIVSKSGKKTPYYFTGLRTIIGNASYLVGMGIDITERKQAEEALIEIEKGYRRLVETMNDGIGIQDENGLITYVNNKFCQMLDYKSDDVIGKPVTNFLDDHNRQILKNQISIRKKGKVKPYEIEWTCKGGRKIHTIMSPQAILDNNGQFKGSFSVITDISKRKQVEELLRKNKERFRNLTELTSDWIWEVDKKGFYTYVSPKIHDMLGYKPEEIIGKTPFDLMPPDEANRVSKIFNTIVASQQPFDCLENINLHKDGHPVVFETSGIPVFGSDGEFCGYRGIDRDISERKRAEGALQKAHKELERRVKERTRELEIKTKSLEEINTAMKVLLKKREDDKTELEDNVLTNVKELVEPYFEKINKTKLDDQQEAFLSIIESNMKEIISPFTRKMSLKYLNLTPTEIRIANLIRYGSPSKKIAELLNVSPRTIDTHRKNIRRKIGLQGQRGNLRSHLLSLH